MIKANELRSGNYLLFDEDGKWTEQKLDYVAKDTRGFNGWFACFGWCSCTLEDRFNDGELSVKGVPLTPEILEACGFEYIHEAGGYCSKDHIVFEYKDNEWGFCMFCSNDKDCTIPIKHLHQLQNLYYALTGEELNYKP